MAIVGLDKRELHKPYDYPAGFAAAAAQWGAGQLWRRAVRWAVRLRGSGSGGCGRRNLSISRLIVMTLIVMTQEHAVAEEHAVVVDPAGYDR